MESDMKYQSSHGKRSEATTDQSMSLILTYYGRPFAYLHEALRRTGFDIRTPHPVRQRFWHLLPEREYPPLEARPLLQKYLICLEEHLAEIVSSHSVAYWLHLYRRLSPGPAGGDEKPLTIGLVRATLEAAIEKHAQHEPCDGVGISDEVPIEDVLGGLLMAYDFEPEREALEHGSSQLVLVDFDLTELREFYDVERLAYEIWRASAQLRAVGKGASIFLGQSTQSVIEVRSPELQQLITAFDHRLGGYARAAVSATGVMFARDPFGNQPRGVVFLPHYNIQHLPIEPFNEFFARAFETRILVSDHTNFIWLPFNLREYLHAHLPFADAFRHQYGVKLEAVLAVVAALCHNVVLAWTYSSSTSIVRYWQRAYEGPSLTSMVQDQIMASMPAAARVLDIDEQQLGSSDIAKAVQFWTLDADTAPHIDLSYSGPHSIFLPYGSDRVFIDYAWIDRRLYDLFWSVSIPDQTFKGDYLEEVVRGGESVLPVGACEARDGQERQIDAAFDAGTRLVIAECRVASHSIGFDRGDPEAIRFRTRKINKALEDVDDRAQWLAKHPVGKNYDVSHFQEIVPLVVSPFVEYIPSLDSEYWLTDDLPRVLTPWELEAILREGRLTELCHNSVSIA